MLIFHMQNILSSSVPNRPKKPKDKPPKRPEIPPNRNTPPFIEEPTPKKPKKYANNLR